MNNLYSLLLSGSFKYSCISHSDESNDASPMTVAHNVVKFSCTLRSEINVDTSQRTGAKNVHVYR